MVGKALAVVMLAACSATTPPPLLPTPPAPEPPPVVVAPVEAPKPPPLAIDPYLVATLPPLGDKHGNLDHHAVATSSKVTMVMRDGEHARVRIARTDDAIDRSWTATFIDAAGKHLAPCTIVGWDATQLECTTPLALEKMTLTVALEPPPRESLIRRVMLAQAQGDELLVTFAAGTNDDLTDDSIAVLVDDANQAVPKGDCKIVRMAPTLSMCRTHAKVDQLYGVLASRF